MLKILHLMLACFYIDNYAYQENLLPKYHKLAGYDVEIIASPFNYDNKGDIVWEKQKRHYINENGIPVTRIMFRKGKLSKRLRKYDGLYNELERSAPDVIFVHGVQFSDVSVLCRYLKKHPEVKMYADSHTDEINSAHGWVSRRILHGVIWKYYADMLSKKAEKVFGVTPNRCLFLEQVYKLPKEKVELLIMGLDEKEADVENRASIRFKTREKYGISDRTFLILSGGKIDRNKKVMELMQAFSSIRKEDCKLIIFGAPDKDTSQEYMELCKNPNIINVGWISPKESYNLMLSSELGVFPGTHSVLWEQAVGCGLPCIFRKWEGMDHVDAGGNCLFVNEGSVQEIEQVLLKILDDALIYENMKNAAQRVSRQFYYSNIAKRAIGQNPDD